jgi:hypothetical protein
LDESFAWLTVLAEQAERLKARDALLNLETQTAANAAVWSSNGDKYLKRTVKSLKRQAGI